MMVSQILVQGVSRELGVVTILCVLHSTFVPGSLSFLSPLLPS